MAADGAVLVVGADGAIGAAVAARLEVGGHTVIRTSRRGTPGTVPLDLATDPATWRLPKGVSTAVLCAAVTSTEACRLRPDEARRVNVDAPVALGRQLSSAGGRIVFLSTNMVFDGSLAVVPPDPVAAAVIAAAAREPLGLILQVSARADVTYADVAARLAARWGFSPGFVQPRTVAESGTGLEHVPAHTTLDASAVRDRLGIEPPDPWAALDEVS